MHTPQPYVRAARAFVNTLAVLGTLGASAMVGMLAVLFCDPTSTAQVWVFVPVALGTAFALALAFRRLGWSWRAALAVLLLILVLVLSPRSLCAATQAVGTDCW